MLVGIGLRNYFGKGAVGAQFTYDANDGNAPLRIAIYTAHISDKSEAYRNAGFAHIFSDLGFEHAHEWAADYLENWDTDREI